MKKIGLLVHLYIQSYNYFKIIKPETWLLVVVVTWKVDPNSKIISSVVGDIYTKIPSGFEPNLAVKSFSFFKFGETLIKISKLLNVVPEGIWNEKTNNFPSLNIRMLSLDVNLSEIKTGFIFPKSFRLLSKQSN